MNGKSIIVIANGHSNSFYSSLSTDETKVSVVTFAQSIKEIQKKSVAIILLDSDNDVVKGLQWLTTLKKSRNDVPVIFITSVKSHDLVMNAYKLGVRDYFLKPVRISELRRTINVLLSLKSSAKEKRSALQCTNPDIYCKVTNMMSSDIPVKFVCVVHYIEENLSKSLTVKDMAGQANLSKYHFVRTFKRLMGFSPLEYAIILKMHKAKKLLIEKKELPISIVAEEVGYSDQRNFDRYFKHYTGFTPSAYRKNKSQ